MSINASIFNDNTFRDSNFDAENSSLSNALFKNGLMKMKNTKTLSGTFENSIIVANNSIFDECFF